MKRNHIQNLWKGLVCFPAFILSLAALSARAAEWPMFQMDARHSANNTEDFIRFPLENLWQAESGADSFGFSSAIQTNSAVYAAFSNGKLSAFDKLTGAQLWSIKVDGAVHSAPLLPNLSFTPAPLGSRLKKTDSQGIAQFIIDNTGNVLSELDDKREPKKKYLHTLKLDEPLSLTDEHNHTYYMLQDGLGSVSMLTGSLGDPVQNYHYEPYGKSNVTARDKNPFKFTSREYDPDAQLQYNRARYYAPDLGRWITPDPLINFRTAEYYSQDSLKAPMSLNPCAYGRCNPTNYTDPLGLIVAGFAGLSGDAGENPSLGVDQIAAKLFGQIPDWYDTYKEDQSNKVAAFLRDKMNEL